jgi:hypothetical protein
MKTVCFISYYLCVRPTSFLKGVHVIQITNPSEATTWPWNAIVQVLCVPTDARCVACCLFEVQSSIRGLFSVSVLNTSFSVVHGSEFMDILSGPLRIFEYRV